MIWTSAISSITLAMAAVVVAPGRRPFDLAEGFGQLGHLLDGHVDLCGLPIAVNGSQHNVAAFSFVHHLRPALLSACLRKAMRFFSSRSLSPSWRSRP